MLARAARLPVKEFLGRRSSHVVSRGRFFSVRAASSGGAMGRYAIVIKKSTEPSAAKRNTWKRRAYACLKDSLNAHMDILFTIERLPKDAERDTWCSDAHTLMRHLAH